MPHSKCKSELIWRKFNFTCLCNLTPLDYFLWNNWALGSQHSTPYCRNTVRFTGMGVWKLDVPVSPYTKYSKFHRYLTHCTVFYSNIKISASKKTSFIRLNFGKTKTRNNRISHENFRKIRKFECISYLLKIDLWWF